MEILRRGRAQPRPRFPSSVPLQQAAASGPAASRSPACPGQSILLDSEAFALELIESRTQAAGGQTLREGGAGSREGPWARWTGQSAASQRPCRNDGQGPACSERERRLSPLHQALGRVLHLRGTTTKPHPPYPVSVRCGRAGFRAGFHCGAGTMLSTGCLRTWWLRGTRWSGERAGGSGPQRSPPGTGFRGFCPGLELSLLVAVPVA